MVINQPTISHKAFPSHVCCKVTQKFVVSAYTNIASIHAFLRCPIS